MDTHGGLLDEREPSRQLPPLAGVFVDEGGEPLGLRSAGAVVREVVGYEALERVVVRHDARSAAGLGVAPGSTRIVTRIASRPR